MRASAVLIAASIATAVPSAAQAFCGFYVSGADASLYNNATMVVLMRDGTRTVLSMQNNYQGPPEDFAMVVPVPVVLQEENVKTLPGEVFDRVDQLAAPRLVEYWEQDPCHQPRYEALAESAAGPPRSMRRSRGASDDSLGVTVEAEFEVGEYDVVILSARDSAGLDTWLRQENYNIPDGAERVLRPYVEQGTRFFVAKVDVEKVRFVDDKIVLSPLRVHYDTDEFSLPVRLGLLNSAGQQDLIVHILARGQRYEVANYPNVTIPTNVRVEDAVRQEFGAFYDLLFRRTVAKNPGAVVTEYSWDASTCDPCPAPALRPDELMTLGADVIGGRSQETPATQGIAPPPGRRLPRRNVRGFVLTRLHYRYGKDGLEEDLVFRAAPPIVGGRGMPDQEGQLRERDAKPSSVNSFQGRYVILHPWEGEVACDDPRRGRWGGPPGQGGGPTPMAAGNTALKGSAEPRADSAITSVGRAVKEDVPVLGIVAGEVEEALPTDPGPPGAVALARGGERASEPPEGGGKPGGTGGETPPPAASDGNGGCASCAVRAPRSEEPAAIGALILGALVLRRRRRRGSVSAGSRRFPSRRS